MATQLTPSRAASMPTRQLTQVVRYMHTGLLILSLAALAMLAAIGGTVALWMAVGLAVLVGHIGIGLALSANIKITALERQNLELAHSLAVLRQDPEASKGRR